MAGNPIYAGTGNKFQREPVFTSGSALDLGLTYNAYDTANTAFGMRWRSAWERSVVVYGANAFVFRSDGKALRFANQSGSYAADADNKDQLTANLNASAQITGWTYRTASDGSSETYDAAGRLLSILKRDGQSTTLFYSDGSATYPNGDFYLAANGSDSSTWLGVGRLIRVRDTFGREVRFRYDFTDKIAQAIDPSGAIYRFTYDTNLNLSGIVYPDGTSRQFRYNEAALTAGTDLMYSLTGIIDENNVRFATFAYDSQGRATTSHHANGAELYQFAYGTTSTVVTDPVGSARTYGFTTILGVVKSTGVNQPGGSGCAAAANAQTYDANGNVSSRTDFSVSKSCHAYDLTRNLETARVEGLTSASACPADAGAYAVPTNLPASTPQRKTTTAWHPDWRLEVKRAEPKKLITWVYNGQPDPTSGNAIASCAPSTALLPGGKPIAVLCKQVEQATTDATGTLGFAATVTGTARTSTWTYNQYGQVLTANGPRTDVTDTTTYSYYADTVFDAAGVGHTLGDLQTLTNAKGQLTLFAQYDRHRHPLEIQDANGNVTRLTYHPRGWLTAKSVGPASGTRETTQYDYDAVGQLKKVTNPDTSYITYIYDDAHRLTDISDGKGNAIHYTLDAMGNRTQEEVKDPLGTLARSQRSVYDALGRLQNLITPPQ